MYNYLREAVKNVPEKLAIQYKERMLNYRELDKIVKKLAGSINIDTDARYNIGIVCNNPLYFTVSLLAISYLGGVAVPIYAYTGKDRINELIQFFSLEYLIVEKNCDSIIEFDNERIVFSTFDMFIYHNKINMANHTLENCELILLTSGTTGVPKGIMLSKENIRSNVNAIGNYLKLTQEDKVLMVKNMNHSSSIVGELLVSLANTCTVVFNSKILTPQSLVNTIYNSGITIFFAVPTILRDIVLKRDKLQMEKMGELKVINFYGAPMPVEDINILIDLLPNCNLIYSYGLTEASPRVTYIEKKDLVRKLGSSGKPIDNVKIRIKDNKINEIDEIIVDGPNVMLGYYNELEKTKRTVIDGELYTGDFGYIDEEGYLYVCGRKDNMMISAGKNIYPEEIEQVIQTVNGVKDVLVRGVPDDKGVEKLTAYLTIDENVELEKRLLFDVCKNKLENYKVPSHFVFVKDLKKTTSGKILRKQNI